MTTYEHRPTALPYPDVADDEHPIPYTVTPQGERALWAAVMAEQEEAQLGRVFDPSRRWALPGDGDGDWITWPDGTRTWVEADDLDHAIAYHGHAGDGAEAARYFAVDDEQADADDAAVVS